MTSSYERQPGLARLLLLTAILFVGYLCVAIPLPSVPVYVTATLGLDNAWAGLAVGVAFFATILTRGRAGAFTDHHGAKAAVWRGLSLYAAGSLIALVAGAWSSQPWLAYGVLLLGRLVLGLGESLVGVGVISWGVGMVGPAQSGKVLALVGAAIYGALAIGGPIGLLVLDHAGFTGAMLLSAVLPCLGLIAIWRMHGIAPHPQADRPPLSAVIRRIWMHGMVVCLQGIGFAAIGAFFALYFMHRQWMHAGLGLTAFGTGFVLVRLCLGHLPDRIGGLPIAIGSLVVEAIGQAMIWSAHDPLLALAGAFLTGLGCSMVFPAMGREVVHLVQPHLRGTALGAYSAFQDLAYGLTGPVAGLLADRAGYDSVFLIGSAAALAGLCMAIYLRFRALAAAEASTRPLV
ncbi:MFS transporter [Dyella sp.]|uniref:MFS transporter n=1 Tax=Dyella sp. TaxID=1869338 RepID=UPI002ED02BFE